MFFLLDFFFFFFNDTATTEIYTLSLHDALPIFLTRAGSTARFPGRFTARTTLPYPSTHLDPSPKERAGRRVRSEEHTSELQSRQYLVCRLLLEKKKKKSTQN